MNSNTQHVCFSLFDMSLLPQVGNRLLQSAGEGCGGHRVYPLVMQAQKRLCALAFGLLKERELRLEVLDEAFQTTQAKKRRRKVCHNS